ncbi:MAG: hypothetical protein WC683_07270 [bacterium]
MTSERENLLLLAQAHAELAARQRTCPLAHFEPHNGQKPVYVSRKPIVIVLAGNRYGKTHALVAGAQAAALGYRPWEVDGFELVRDGDKWDFPPRAEMPAASWVRRWDGLPIAVPNKILMVSGLSLARGIGEIIQPKWNALWPQKVAFKPYLGSLGTWNKILLPNGSEVYFGSALQENLAFEGFASDAIFLDEPQPRRVFTAVRRGTIDNKAQVTWTMTPLGDANMAWVAADLINNNNPDVEIVRGSSYDNPHVDRDSLDKFFSDPSLSPEERRARMSGEIAALGRRIVTTFTQSSIIESSSLHIPPEVPRLLVVDPHHSRKPFMIWVAVEDGGEQLTIYREWPEEEFEKIGPSQVTLDVLNGVIKTAEGRENIVWRICDPAFGRQKAKVLGTQFPSFVDGMSEYGLTFDTRVDNDLERGIQTLRDGFKISSTTGRSRILVSSNCHNAIRALQFWSYEDAEAGEMKPSEAFKDPVDCVRYAAMYRLPREIESYSYIDEG